MIAVQKELDGMGKRAICRCMICGRKLTNPESVRLGIGPVCRMKRQNNESGGLEHEQEKAGISPRPQGGREPGLRRGMASLPGM